MSGNRSMPRRFRQCKTRWRGGGMPSGIVLSAASPPLTCHCRAWRGNPWWSTKRM